jgi:Arc/MetJ-type ribon-helix-helix transcriptional regulator
MTKSVADKIDELLKDDKNFSTRAGVRFLTEVIKDAIRVIEKSQGTIEHYEEKQSSVETRLGNVERGLNEFMELRAREQKKAEEERTKWRWLFITPVAYLVINEFFGKWLPRIVELFK